MTALNLFVGPDGIDIFTDTVIYDMARGAAVAGFASKVILLPHHNAVMAATGFSWVAIVMAGVVATSGIQSFDDLVQRLSSLVSEAVNRDPAGAACFGTFELVIAGFSESRENPEAYIIRSFPHQGWPEWSVRKISNHTSPKVQLRFNPDDIKGSGIAIVREQRRWVCGSSDFKDLRFHAVGGDLQHTKLTREAVVSTVIQRWNDMIGQPITSEES